MGSAISKFVNCKTGLVIILTFNKLAALRAAWGQFGTLLMGTQDCDSVVIWKTFMKLLACEVTPKNLSTWSDCGLLIFSGGGQKLRPTLSIF